MFTEALRARDVWGSTPVTYVQSRCGHEGNERYLELMSNIKFLFSSLNVFDDVRMQRATLELVVAQARRWDAAATAGEVLGLLTQDGRHNELLDAGLVKLGECLAQDEVKAAVSPKS